MAVRRIHEVNVSGLAHPGRPVWKSRSVRSCWHPQLLLALLVQEECTEFLASLRQVVQVCQIELVVYLKEFTVRQSLTMSYNWMVPTSNWISRGKSGRACRRPLRTIRGEVSGAAVLSFDLLVATWDMFSPTTAAPWEVPVAVVVARVMRRGAVCTTTLAVAAASVSPEFVFSFLRGGW